MAILCVIMVAQHYSNVEEQHFHTFIKIITDLKPFIKHQTS
jgi:hypothetical protein